MDSNKSQHRNKREVKKKHASVLVCPFCKTFSFENSPGNIKCPLLASLQRLKNGKKGNISHCQSNQVPGFKQLSPAGHRKRKHEDMIEQKSEVNVKKRISHINKLKEAMHKLLEGIGEFPKDESLELPPHLKDACITIASLEGLFPGRWLNDHLINFYCLYLTKETFAMQQESFVIYSTFFYESLTKFCEDGAKFDIRRIQRQKRENMFEKNFIIIPINLNRLHWITLVICHPCLIKDHLVLKSNTSDHDEAGAISLPTRAVYEVKNDQQRQPSMLIFDSLVKETQDVFQNIRRYLTEEYKRFYNVEVDFDNCPGCYVECPQQQNLSDCGIFTLQFIEMVLQNMKTFPGVDQFKLICTFNRNLFHTTAMNMKRAKLMTLITKIIKKSRKNLSGH